MERSQKIKDISLEQFVGDILKQADYKIYRRSQQTAQQKARRIQRKATKIQIPVENIYLQELLSVPVQEPIIRQRKVVKPYKKQEQIVKLVQNNSGTRVRQIKLPKLLRGHDNAPLIFGEYISRGSAPHVFEESDNRFKESDGYIFIKKIQDSLNRSRQVLYCRIFGEYNDLYKKEYNIPVDQIGTFEENRRFYHQYDVEWLFCDVSELHIKEIPEEQKLEGACDYAKHTVFQTFPQQDGTMITMKTLSIKSTENNCLIVALQSKSEIKSKAKSIRLSFKLQDGPIAIENVSKIAKYLKVTYTLYQIVDNSVVVLSESDSISNNHVNLLINQDHYWIIDSDMTRLRSQQFSQSRQIQDIPNIAPNVCDQIVYTAKSCSIEDEDLEQINFKQVVQDPSFEQIQDFINDKSNNLMILGPGGVGKTYILKQLNGIMCATTGQAANLLKGQTIHSYMLQNKKIQNQRIIIDEISMMGCELFDKVDQWIGCSNQLILSGDFLQLPPVNDRFFFQSSAFSSFARKTILIKLNTIKRQDNVQQIEFLNDLRVGKINMNFLKKLQQNKVENPDLVLASKRDFVQEYNLKMLQNLGSQIVEYKVIIENQKGEIKQKKNLLAVGCKAIITKNFDNFFNGQQVIVVETNQDSVKVDYNGSIYEVKYHEDYENGIKTKEIPVECSYSLTIHKSQGQTVDKLVVHTDDIFEQGMAYVALSRCKNLDNCQLIGNLNIHQKGWQPNDIAKKFVETQQTCEVGQLLFISNTKKQLKNIVVKKWQDPVASNHIYIDFETYLDEAVQRPYYNKILHIKRGEIVHEQSYFDQLWVGGQRCNVGEETWNYIKEVATKFGDNLHRLKQDKEKTAIFKAEKKRIPTIIGYNLAGFDLHFILQQYLCDDEAARRFQINSIYKGTSIIFFQLFDRISQEIVLKTHDMYQILGCSLSNALKSYCGNEGKQLCEKIEFKHEIMHILAHYKKNPDILRPGVETQIQERIFDENTYSFNDIKNKKVKLYDEVIRYADNDVNVLPTLYKCVDNIVKEIFNANVTDFLTSGSLAWYGSIINLPKECYEKVQRDRHDNKISNKLNTKLYKLERKEEDFIRQSIKGGRVCPRIHQVKDEKLVYLDISGMYASIMSKEVLPYGKACWLENDQIKIMKNTIKQFKQGDNWRVIYEQLTKIFGLFIAEVDFEENQYNLEPIVQFKKQGKTIYTVERRTDAITSIDIALLISSGGQIFDIKKVLRWENNDKIMSNWINKTLKIKEEGEKEGNIAKRTFAKLLANSAYGQTLKRDRQQVTSIVTSWSQADDFVKNNQLQQIFDYNNGNVSILVGEKIQKKDSFVTSRCSFIGSFVLGYTRAMIHEIVEIACPNRYNSEGIDQQPIYGDTDSLVFRKWQADRLIKAGYIAKENGKLTDELADTNSNWFLPERLKEQLPQGSIAIQQDFIWKNATEQEKRDPNNFYFYYATHFIAQAPKAYACKYSNNLGEQIKEKMKFKGIPASALINNKKLDFDLVNIAFEVAKENETKDKKDRKYKVAVLQGSIQILKKFTKKEGSEMFSQVVDSNLRNKVATRTLFKTQWQGRKHIRDNNVTIPYGWQNNIQDLESIRSDDSDNQIMNFGSDYDYEIDNEFDTSF